MAEAVPDRSLFPRLQARLPLGCMGRAFYPFRTLTSTQDELRRLADSGAPEGTVVLADHQTRGRGRKGGEWLDEPGTNLLFSVLLRPDIPAAQVPRLSLLAAVAAADGLTAVTEMTIGIRWPNDLQVKERKVAGILAEAETVGDRLSHVVLGIGVNVNQTEFAADLSRPATSLTLESGRELDREALLAALLASLDRWYARYLREGFPPVREGWRRASVTLGHPVDGDGVTGIAEDLDEDGALRVRTAEGALARLVAGEIR